MDAAGRDIAHHFHPQTNLAAHPAAGPMVIARGEGVYIYDADGRRYLEGMAGLWCCALGFSEQRLVAAAAEQMARLPYMHSFAHRSHAPVIELAERLAARAPAGLTRAFFASSGSEANDTAVKLVWYFNNARGRPKKKKILARDRAYHGVTIVSGSLTGLPHMHKGFDLPVDRIVRLTCPHLWRFGRQGETEQEFTARLAAELEETIEREGADTIAAMIAEPLIGAGGVLLPPEGYFAAIQPILKRHDILLIADEVITGFGRTGAFWGSERFGLSPDILTCAKALSSGYQPISAVLVNEEIYAEIARASGEIGTFGHGFTYSGHPVCAAVANETLAIYEERDIVAIVRAREQLFTAGLDRFVGHPLVGEVRRVGLIGALEIAADAVERRSFPPELKAPTRIAAACANRGVLLRPIMESIALCPPLIISEAELEEMFAALGGAVDEVAGELL
jgi:4-aminobutyrate--pyruvate transaminase